MQQENDDMDELLRKAAENYPLKTDNADWEKVRLALAAESFTIEPVRRKNYRSLWLLLLLLPLGLGSYYYFSSSTPSNKVVAVKNTTNKNNNSSQPISSQTKTGAVERSTQQNSETVNSNSASIQARKVIQQNVDQTANSNTVTIQLPAKNNSRNVVTGSKTTVAINQASSEETNEVTAINKSADVKTNQEKNTTTGVINATDKNVDNNLKEKKDVVISDEVKKSDQPVKKDSRNKKQRNNFLYAGVIVGPDISTVKFQSIKSTGINRGIVLGYQLNKKLSVETGLTWDKKFYYSEGQYFNTGKIYLPPNAKINNVTGNCKMIEVPLNIKYNIKSSGKTTWSSTVGLSSYFMKQENYSYTVVSSGAPYPYNKSYNESSKYLFSVMNISAGYNHSLGKIGTLRVEPYVKVPFKGMGIGSLPITSAGINVGITKRIF